MTKIAPSTYRPSDRKPNSHAQAAPECRRAHPRYLTEGEVERLIGAAKRNPSHPYLLATQTGLWLVWKEFDGEHTSVLTMTSRDNGRTWTHPQTVAQTADASDHPLLISNGRQTFLSWQTRADGYRLLPLEAAP